MGKVSLCVLLFLAFLGFHRVETQTLGLPAASVPRVQVSVDTGHAEQLWQQARQAWTRGEAYKPGQMRIVSDEIDRRGQVSSSTVTLLSMRYVGGQTQTEVIMATKDGKDVTAQTRADYARRDSNASAQTDGPFNPDDLIPFTASAFPDLRRGPSQLQGGFLVLPYEITKKKSGSVGRLFLSPAGWPLRMTYTLQPLPPLVSMFEGEVHFSRLENDSLVASQMSFLAEGGLLLVRKRFSIRMEFTDYRYVGIFQ